MSTTINCYISGLPTSPGSAWLTALPFLLALGDFDFLHEENMMGRPHMSGLDNPNYENAKSSAKFCKIVINLLY
jgi:hypothetical protein